MSGNVAAFHLPISSFQFRLLSGGGGCEELPLFAFFFSVAHFQYLMIIPVCPAPRASFCSKCGLQQQKLYAGGYAKMILLYFILQNMYVVKLEADLVANFVFF